MTVIRWLANVIFTEIGGEANLSRHTLGCVLRSEEVPPERRLGGSLPYKKVPAKRGALLGLTLGHTV